ncbi:hypothetical protein UFOVP23_39 [uncultured Caudovirales phage]|uniref:Uncharacterized protein n=1 Tax=uncultured Caudovirales phage TaxID=2100421 RepID=A0A6J5TAQ0_9CAUD|nr:hypothetical protein UFOVP23_39 [uncultured Caudovirales phage]
MDPITSGLLVAASFISSTRQAKSQAKLQGASIKMEVEQARLQAAEQAYHRTRAFSENLSTNLALSSVGVGGTTGFLSAYGQSSENFQGDINSINTAARFAIAQGNAGMSANKAQRFAKNVDATVTATQLADQLGLFKMKAKGK